MPSLTNYRHISMREVRRIAQLARVHGEPYLEQLLAIATYATDEEVRRYAYEEAMNPRYAS